MTFINHVRDHQMAQHEELYLPESAKQTYSPTSHRTLPTVCF